MFDGLIWLMKLNGWECYHTSMFCQRWRGKDRHGEMQRIKLDYLRGGIYKI